jgi:hypothetical protein
VSKLRPERPRGTTSTSPTTPYGHPWPRRTPQPPARESRDSPTRSPCVKPASLFSQMIFLIRSSKPEPSRLLGARVCHIGRRPRGGQSAKGLPITNESANRSIHSSPTSSPPRGAHSQGHRGLGRASRSSQLCGLSAGRRTCICCTSRAYAQTRRTPPPFLRHENGGNGTVIVYRYQPRERGSYEAIGSESVCPRRSEKALASVPPSCQAPVPQHAIRRDGLYF